MPECWFIAQLFPKCFQLLSSSSSSFGSEELQRCDSPSASYHLSRRLGGFLWDPTWLHLLHSGSREETKVSCDQCVLLWEDAHEHKSTHCVSLECFNGSVLPQFTDVDAHVCTTGGERVVTLPVHVKCRSCGRMERGILDRNKKNKHLFILLGVSFVYLSGKETVVWLLLYGHPIWLLSVRRHVHLVWLQQNITSRDNNKLFFKLFLAGADLQVYLVYACAQDKIAFFVPLKGKDGTFVLAESTGQVTCGAQQQNNMCQL